jgi:hypothetical protein
MATDPYMSGHRGPKVIGRLRRLWAQNTYSSPHIPTVSNDQYTDPKGIFVELPNWCNDQYSDP